MNKFLILFMSLSLYCWGNDNDSNILRKIDHASNIQHFEEVLKVFPQYHFSEDIYAKAVTKAISRYATEFPHIDSPSHFKYFFNFLNTYIHAPSHHLPEKSSSYEKYVHIGIMLGTYSFPPLLQWFKNQKYGKHHMAYHALVTAGESHYVSHVKEILTAYGNPPMDNEFLEVLLIKLLSQNSIDCFKAIFDHTHPHITNHTLQMVFIFCCLNQNSCEVKYFLKQYHKRLSIECLISGYIASHTPYKSEDADDPVKSILYEELKNQPDLEFFPTDHVPFLGKYSPIDFLLQENKIIHAIVKEQHNFYRVHSHLAPLPFYPPFMVTFDHDENGSLLKLHLLKFKYPFLRYQGKLYYQALGTNHMESKKAYHYSYHNRYGDDLLLPIHFFLILEEEKTKPLPTVSKIQHKP